MLLTSLLVGCGVASHSPEAALHSYAQALREGNVERAYSLMSAEFRAQHSREEFAKMLADNPEEAELTAQRFSVEEGAVAIRAELKYGYDETVQMRKEGGQWKISTNPLSFYGQATPRDTVRSFVRAYNLKRWDVMLQFVPDAFRERMTVEMVQKQFDGPRKEEMREMMDEVRVNLDAPSADSQSGNQARLRYGETYEVELVREQGLWKIKRL
ncbi:MAG: hypothetical protein GY811_29960 [Myxococcales bacterium]|nr:hypothetical protein [Myxococcales bacterium]